MKYKAIVTFDSDIEDKDEFYDNLSDALDRVDCNDLDIESLEPVEA